MLFRPFRLLRLHAVERTCGRPSRSYLSANSITSRNLSSSVSFALLMSSDTCAPPCTALSGIPCFQSARVQTFTVG